MMEGELHEEVSETPEASLEADQNIKFPEEKVESSLGVRKSLRPRKQSKRALDSVESNEDEVLGVPQKKQRGDFKLKTGRRKDILPNGCPFKCSLCESPYINNSKARAKWRKVLTPIQKEKFGQILQLCVKCAIALNYAENKGPTPEQRAEFEEEGKQFAKNLVEHLKDTAAERLYCSFYQTTKCGCIQCYITGIPANRKRRTSLSGAECGSGTVDTQQLSEVKSEEGLSFQDYKTEQTQRARYLLSLLKESMSKKRSYSSKKPAKKDQLVAGQTAEMMKEFEKFILANRVKLKEMGICERGCQKVLCYSNNYLHKKSAGNQTRLQRTKGRAALGRLLPVQDLHKLKCCEKGCVKLGQTDQGKISQWRHRAQQGQKGMWNVLEEMLSPSATGKSNCFKFITMVTGCSFSTVQKIYADILLCRGTVGCVEKRGRGMKFNWKRQKELGKSHKYSTVISLLNQAPGSAPPLLPRHDESAVLAAVPTAEMKPQFHHGIQTPQAGSPQSATQSHLSEKVEEENADKKNIKETFLQLFEDIKDPQQIASVQQMLDKLQKDLKQDAEHKPGAVLTTLSSLTTDLSSRVSDVSPTPSCSSSIKTEMFATASQDQHVTSAESSKSGRPFVDVKVQQTLPLERKPAASQVHQPSSMEQKAAASNPKLELKLTVEGAGQAEVSSSQLICQPHILSCLSSLGTETEAIKVFPNASLPVSFPLITGNRAAEGPYLTASSVVNSSLKAVPPQFGLFQLASQTCSESSHHPTQSPKMISVCPEPATGQIQPLSVPASGDLQNIQLHLVSPLIIGQNLMIPVSQSTNMSIILPKQVSGGSQNGDVIQAHPVTCCAFIAPGDSVITQLSSMQQPFQSDTALTQTLLDSGDVNTNKHSSNYQSTAGCISAFSDAAGNVQYTKQLNTCSGDQKPFQAVNNQKIGIHSEQILGTALPPNIVPTPYFETRGTLKSENSDPSQGSLNSNQERETVNQISINQYLPSSLLNQVSASISTCNSTSFEFDALADSPVKDSLTLLSPSMQTVPVVTSSLLCEMLRSVAPLMSHSSPCSNDFVSSSSALVVSTPSFCTPNSQRLMSSMSTQKSSPVTSAYCQSLSFSTHTTPSAMSNHPVLMTSKIEQASTSTATGLAHNLSLAHSPISVGRLNRQRDPPQVGIVHPHVSSVKNSPWHALGLSPSITSSSSPILNSSSIHGSSVTSITSDSSLSASTSVTSHQNSNLQQAVSVPEPSTDISTRQSHQQQHRLLSVLQNTQQAGGHRNHPLINISQASLSAQSGNPNDNVTSLVMTNDSQNPAISPDSHTRSVDHNDYALDLLSYTHQHAPGGSTNFVSDQTVLSLENHLPLSNGVQAPVSISNANIIFGGIGSQLQPDVSHFLQNVVCPNTGQVKVIPIVLSDVNSLASVTSLFPQSSHLVWNMSPGVNLSPQSFNRDSLLNTSTNSSQNTPVQLPMLQVIAPAKPCLTPRSQDSHQIGPQNKDGNQTMQISVVPFINNNVNTHPMTVSESQRSSSLLSSKDVSELSNIDSFKSHFSDTSELICAHSSEPDQVVTQSSLPGKNKAHIVYDKGTGNLQPVCSSSEMFASGQNVFMSYVQSHISTDSSAYTSVEIPSSSATTHSTFSLMNEARRLNQTSSLGNQNTAVGHNSKIDMKQQIYLSNQATDMNQQTQQYQIPFQILSMVQPVQELTNSGNDQSSSIVANIALNQPAFQNIVLGPQLQSVLNISSPNQVLLPVQPVPFSKLTESDQTVSNTMQRGQAGQHSSGAVESNNIGDLVPVVHVTRNVITHNANMSVQSTIANAGSQQTSTATACASISKHRPIRPKLPPVPSQPTKLSLMLVPDKPGYPSYKLAKVSQSALSLQQIPDQSGQEEVPISQDTVINQQSQNKIISGPAKQSINTILASGTSQQQQKNIIVAGDSQQSVATILSSGASQQSLNTILASGISQQSLNTILASGMSQQSLNTTLTSHTSQQLKNILMGITQQPQHVLVAGTSQPSLNTILATGTSQQPQSNICVAGSSVQPHNILVTGPSQKPQSSISATASSHEAESVSVTKSLQQSLHNILTQVSAEQPQDGVLRSGISEQLQKSSLVARTCHQQNNTVLIPRASGESQNALSHQQKVQVPQVNAALLAQLQLNQQPRLPAQILLFSQSQGNQNTETVPLSRQLNDDSKLTSQELNTQAVSTASQNNVSNILVQQPGSTQMSTAPCEAQQTYLIQNEASEETSAQAGALQDRNQNQGFQVGPLFISSLQGGGTIPLENIQYETFEVAGFQSSGHETSSQQQGTLLLNPIDFNLPGLNTVHNASFQITSLAGTPLVAPRQQSDIQRLNPQVAAQLSSGGVQVLAQQTCANTFVRPGHVVSSTSSQHLQTTQSTENIVTGPVKLDTPTNPSVSFTKTFILQPKVLSEDTVAQSVEAKAIGKAVMGGIPFSSHTESPAYFNLQTHDGVASYGADILPGLSPNQFLSQSDLPLESNQLLLRLAQPPVLAVEKGATNEDQKPVVEPVQYLQCKEVIDLTNDSPPATPSRFAQNKGKMLGLAPLLNNQLQDHVMREERWKEIYTRDDKSNIHNFTIIPQHQDQKQLNQPNCSSAKVHSLPNETVPESQKDESHFPVAITYSKKDDFTSVQKLEEIPEEIRQMLIASLQAHAAGNPDVHLETKTFIPTDDLSYQSFLSSRGSLEHTEDHYNALTKAIGKNKCPSAVVTISTNQRFQQSLAKTQSQMSSVVSTHTASNTSNSGLVIAHEGDKELSRTIQRTNSTVSDSGLSVSGAVVNLTELMNLSVSQTPAGSSTSANVPAVTVGMPSSQSTSSLCSSIASHKLPMVTTTPALLLNSLTRSPAGRASAPGSRSVIHPLTQSTVAFMRTTNTPTDAVGPPNITIISPTQASSSTQLRLRHENSSISVTTAVSSQAVTTACPSSLPILNVNQLPRLLQGANTSSSAAVPNKTQESNQVEQVFCPTSGGKDKTPGQPVRRLSLENKSAEGNLKEFPASQTSAANSKSVNRLMKSIESPAPAKPKPRKRASTIMDLLKSKEKQAAANKTSSFPVNSTPGPVTFVIAGTPGAPNLLVVDSSAGQPNIDSNALNITFKNLHLLTSCTDKHVTSASSGPAGFTILQPSVLQPSLSSGVATNPLQVASVPVIEQYADLPAAALSVQVQNMNTSKTSASAFAQSLLQTKNVSRHQEVCDQTLLLSSQAETKHPELVKGRMEMLKPNADLSLVARTSEGLSSTDTQGFGFKNGELKIETAVHFQVVDQPQATSASPNIKKPPAADLKPKFLQADPFNGEKLKVKTSSAESSISGEGLVSQNIQVLDNSEKNKKASSTGTIKKLLLLHDKPSPYMQHIHSAKSGLQISHNPSHFSSDQSQLSQRSPQLLQLMKSKSVSLDQSTPLSSLKYDKSHMLKLPNTTTITLPLLGTNTSHGSNLSDAFKPLDCRGPKEDCQQRDQLPGLKSQSSGPVSQSKDNKPSLLETEDKGSSENRNCMLPSQNPLLANILFTGSGSNHASQFSLDYGSKSSLHSTQNSVGKTHNTEEDQLSKLNSLSGSQSFSRNVGNHKFENNKERHLKFDTETEVKDFSSVRNVISKESAAYGHKIRQEGNGKDMTRVNRVIEDIYKFPDEGDETSPPPVFGGLKSHVKQTFTFGSAWHRKSTESSDASVSLPENMLHISVPKSEVSVVNTLQYSCGNSVDLQPSSLCSSLLTSGSYQRWRSPKKLKARKVNDKSSSKFNPKKVQFSDDVTRRPEPQCGQTVTVSSSSGSVASDEPFNYVHIESGNSHDFSEAQHHVTDQCLSVKYQDQVTERLDSPILNKRYISDARTSKRWTDQAEELHTRPLASSVKDQSSKELGLTYVQKDKGRLSASNTESDDQHETELPHFTKLGQKPFVGRLTECEQGKKQRGNEDIDGDKTFRQADENVYIFQENMHSSYLLDTNDSQDVSSFCSILKPPVELEPTEEVSSYCHEIAGSKAENRNMTVRKALVSDDNFLLANSDHGLPVSERKHYSAEKKEIVHRSPESFRENINSDAIFDQQSSFDILSTQGYSRLSRHRLNRTYSDQIGTETSIPSQFKSQNFLTNEISSPQFENMRDFHDQARFNPIPGYETPPETAERQPSESPLIRQKMLESNFEISQQMKKGYVHVLKDTRTTSFEGRKPESPEKVVPDADKMSDDISNSLFNRDKSQLNKEIDCRRLSASVSTLTSPIFSDALNGRSGVLSSLESLSCLKKEIKDLKGENHYLKREVAKAERKEKEQLRQRQQSSSDRQRGTEIEKPEKMYYTSPSTSQQYVLDSDSVMPPRKKHPSSTGTVGMFSCSPLPGSEHYRGKADQPLAQQTSFGEGSARGFLYARNNSMDEYSLPENHIRENRDLYISSAVSRPASQLEMATQQYESARHRYPSSEMKSLSSKLVSDGESFLPLPELTRHRHLSSSLGLQVLTDVDPPPYDMAQRQRNPSTSSLKSAFQDADFPSFDSGARSRNPSSSSWIRYFDYGTDLAVIRSRNPSGSSNRRSRPGSSSSDREHVVNIDELPLFSDIVHTRSRNSSGESIEPTVEFMDPQQFIEYCYQASEHKRTKH